MNQILWDLYQHHPWVLFLLFILVIGSIEEGLKGLGKRKVIYRTLRKCPECPHCQAPDLPHRRIRL